MDKSVLRASFIIVRKKPDVITLIVREDKKVWFNFGSKDIWVNIEDLKKTDNLHKDSGRNKKYKDWVMSKKFQTNYKKTIEVLNESDLDTAVKKFIKDFKKDRCIIIRQDVEVDPNIKPGDL